MADFRVPEVMEYVTEKADLYELQKKVKSWERKVEIAEVKCLLNKNYFLFTSYEHDVQCINMNCYWIPFEWLQQSCDFEFVFFHF